jgi:hypothetical protein
MAGWADAAIVALGPAGVVVGVLLGRAGERRRDVRTSRQAAYIAWLQTARSIMELPPDIPAGSVVKMPSDEARRRLNNLTVEIELVASQPVKEAANAFHGRVTGPELAQTVSGQYKLGSNEWIARFDEALEEPRRAVVKAMRRDLGTYR